LLSKDRVNIKKVLYGQIWGEIDRGETIVLSLWQLTKEGQGMESQNTAQSISILNMGFAEAVAQGWHCDDAYMDKEDAAQQASLVQSDTQDVKLIKDHAFGLVLWVVATREI
jgi:hypothetical protein